MFHFVGGAKIKILDRDTGIAGNWRSFGQFIIHQIWEGNWDKFAGWLDWTYKLLIPIDGSFLPIYISNSFINFDSHDEALPSS